jgi:hypothetical protein
VGRGKRRLTRPKVRFGSTQAAVQGRSAIVTDGRVLAGSVGRPDFARTVAVVFHLPGTVFTFRGTRQELHRWALRSTRDEEMAMIDAPKLSSAAQSILHIWTALESIFPRVTTEVSFRVALYMAQLNAKLGDRREYRKLVRKA